MENVGESSRGIERPTLVPKNVKMDKPSSFTGKYSEV